MRWLLVLVLINGLAPDLAEAVEAVAHVAIEGHLPHTATDPCDDDDGPEHGCGTAWHQCGCCPSLAIAVADEAVSQVADASASMGFAPLADLVATGEPSRPFRPPIG